MAHAGVSLIVIQCQLGHSDCGPLVALYESGETV
jgi:hypothetical protein